MAIIGRFYSLRLGHPLQNVPPYHRHLQRVFEIVVERIAHSQTFNGATSQRAKALCDIVVRRAKYPAEVLGEEFAKPACSHGRGGFHLSSPNHPDPSKLTFSRTRLSI